MMNPNDLAALDVQGDLASCLTNQNKLDLAVVLFLEVVQKKTLNYGETHESTTSSRNNLGGVYLRLGEYNRAEELFKTSLRILKETIGDTHPDYLSCSSRLGGVYTRCGRNAEAIALLSDVLEKQKRTVGFTKTTLQTMTNLANAHERMGNHDIARELRETCLQQQRALGGTDDDPLTQAMMINYANSVVSLGRYAEAEVMYENALRKQIQVLGERHPDVEITMKLLYRLYKKMNKDTKASKLLNRMASLFG
jgi:tetratricopeptide (TPR) repeat protein